MLTRAMTAADRWHLLRHSGVRGNAPSVISLVAVLMCWMPLVSVATADGQAAAGATRHAPEDVPLHRSFYADWKRKSDGGSCCNDGDCYPTAAHYDPARAVWYAKRREDGKWLRIPKYVFNQATDTRRSPDGRPHLCAPPPKINIERDLGTPRHGLWSGEVICFTPGVGS